MDVVKIEQRKVQGLQREPQERQTVLLASPIYIGKAPVEEEKIYIKRGAKIGLGAPLLFMSVGSIHPHALMMSFPFLSK